MVAIQVYFFLLSTKQSTNKQIIGIIFQYWDDRKDNRHLDNIVICKCCLQRFMIISFYHFSASWKIFQWEEEWFNDINEHWIFGVFGVRTHLILIRYCARATDSALPVIVMVRSILPPDSRSSQFEIRIMAPLSCL